MSLNYKLCMPLSQPTDDCCVDTFTSALAAAFFSVVLIAQLQWSAELRIAPACLSWCNLFNSFWGVICEERTDSWPYFEFYIVQQQQIKELCFNWLNSFTKIKICELNLILWCLHGVEVCFDIASFNISIFAKDQRLKHNRKVTQYNV